MALLTYHNNIGLIHYTMLYNSASSSSVTLKPTGRFLCVIKW